MIKLNHHISIKLYIKKIKIEYTFFKIKNITMEACGLVIPAEIIDIIFQHLTSAAIGLMMSLSPEFMHAESRILILYKIICLAAKFFIRPFMSCCRAARSVATGSAAKYNKFIPFSININSKGCDMIYTYFIKTEVMYRENGSSYYDFCNNDILGICFGLMMRDKGHNFHAFFARSSRDDFNYEIIFTTDNKFKGLSVKYGGNEVISKSVKSPVINYHMNEYSKKEKIGRDLQKLIQIQLWTCYLKYGNLLERNIKGITDIILEKCGLLPGPIQPAAYIS